MKFKTYKGETLYDVEISYKIDGVRAHKTSEGVVSRAGKPLYNITMDCEIAEIFCGSWEETVSMVRTHIGKPVPKNCIYNLSPIDPRLYVGFYKVITSDVVELLFTEALSTGYEGLVLSTSKHKYKVKPKETEDIIITGIIEGTGKYKGMLGAFVTPKGKVGTGFTDEQRATFFSPTYIGTLIEVESMGGTPNGKFRHPRFIRERFDK